MKRETKKAKAARLAKRRADYARKVAAELRARQIKNARARRARAEAKRLEERARDKRNARARARRAEKRAAELAGGAKKAARAELQAKAGEILSVEISIGRPKSAAPWSHSVAVRDRVAAAVAKVTGGRIETSSVWRASVVQKFPRSHAAIARELARMALVPLEGGTAHIGVITRDGRYHPVTRAFSTMSEVRAMAVDEILKGLLRYLPDTPEEEEEPEEAGDDAGSDEWGAP